MGFFITGKANIEQSDENGKWFTENNLLYMDYDSIIYLVPRGFKTDGYTIPDIVAWLGGSKMNLDIRPAILHDFNCYFHKDIIVKLTVPELRKMGLLIQDQQHKDELFCNDIPIEFLEVTDISFSETNNKFKRMLQSIKNISKLRIEAMYNAVNLNVTWLWTGKQEIELNNIYKENFK